MTPYHRPPRPIVHDPTVLGGRWHLAGTRLAVADIQFDYLASPEDPAQPYRFMDLTADELAQVLQFRFPAIRAVDVTVRLGSISVECVCGEDTHQTMMAWDELEVPCICGRRWRVRTAVQPVGLDTGPSSPPIRRLP